MLVKSLLRSLFKLPICIYCFPQVHSVNSVICSAKSLAITSWCILCLNTGNRGLPHVFWACGDLQMLDFTSVGVVEAAACMYGLSSVPRPEMPGLHPKGPCCSKPCKQHPRCGSFVLNMLDSAIDWPLCLAAVVCNALTCYISFPFGWMKINAMYKIGMGWTILCRTHSAERSFSASCRDGSVGKKSSLFWECLGSFPSITNSCL